MAGRKIMHPDNPMPAIRTLLHPTDFSERSASALDVACSLARDYGASIIVLHVAHVPPLIGGEGLVPPSEEEIRAEADERLKAMDIPEVGIPVERRLLVGDPAMEILRVAREINADMIVIGTHGRTGLGRLLMGSVAEQVVRRSECPVLTVSHPPVKG
jgi:nucleotide-binding universal stress UspA family protein